METDSAVRAPVAGTRERILSVAVELFGERGYAGTSVRDIADRLGVTKAALYYHFPSKERILDALIDPFLEEVGRIVDLIRADPPPQPRIILERMVAAMVGSGAVLFAFANDPSVIKRRIGQPGKLDILAHYNEIVYALAGPAPTPLRVLRARCALGCIRSGVFESAFHRRQGGAPKWGPGVADGPEDGSMAGLCGFDGCGGGQIPRLLLSEEEGREVVEAALAALGRP